MNGKELFEIAKDYVIKEEGNFFEYKPSVPKEVILTTLSKKEQEVYDELLKNYLTLR